MRLVVILCVTLTYIVYSDAQITHGLGAETAATTEIKEDASKLRGQIEKMADVFRYDIFRAVSFRTQTVDNGYNVFIKTRVGFSEYIHVRIHKDLSDKVTLTSLQVDKSKDDPIEYF